MALKTLVTLLSACVLAGCAASTQLITNTKASDTVKAKSFSSYKEVLLIPPKDDPRHLIPVITSRIADLGFKVQVLDPNKPLEASQGTGFVISPAGWLLTCAHVLGDKKEATITLGGKRLIADVVKSDEKADLALLKLREALPADAPALSLRAADKPAAMGEDVFTIGYPLSRILGNNARMTKGLLSATTGLHDDERELQVSAEIQPGNSGGPLLDKEGYVIGIINKTLNPGAIAQSTGSLPQNVNFAIKDAPILEFLKAADEKALASTAEAKAPGLERAAKAVAKIQAGIVGSDADRVDKMVVRFNYVSFWDLWFRFRLFALTAFDYDTQEPLFTAGQYRDNMISNEEVVINATMTQFKKAIAAR